MPDATLRALTPSEVVVLHGDHFAPESGPTRTAEVVLTRGVEVRADRLAEAALAACVLANERAGHVRLTLERKKVLFGLFRREALVAHGAESATEWPEGSAERWIAERVRRGPAEVEDLLAEFIGERTPDGSVRALHRLKAALAARGVLEAEENPAGEALPGAGFVLPAGRRAQVEAASPDPVRALLATTERKRAELWKALVSDIRSAVSRTTESDVHDG